MSGESEVVSASGSQVTKVPFPPSLLYRRTKGECGGVYHAAAAPTSTNDTHTHTHTVPNVAHIDPTCRGCFK